jgi:hypothetical protein
MSTDSSRGWLRRRWHRVAHFHARRLGQSIPPLDELEDVIDKRVASGESEEEATAVFTHAGRRNVGLPPTRADVAFAHERLAKKESRAELGSFLSSSSFENRPSWVYACQRGRCERWLVRRW